MFIQTKHWHFSGGKFVRSVPRRGQSGYGPSIAMQCHLERQVGSGLKEGKVMMITPTPEVTEVGHQSHCASV